MICWRELFDFKSEIERIRRIARQHGWEMSPLLAYLVWGHVSDTEWSAGWYQLPEFDDEVWRQIAPYGTMEIEWDRAR